MASATQSRTIIQIVAQLLYVASLDIPSPTYWRHVRARRDLMVAMREPVPPLLGEAYHAWRAGAEYRRNSRHLDRPRGVVGPEMKMTVLSLIIAIVASCALQIDPHVDTTTQDDTVCGLPTQCAPWNAAANGSNLVLDRNWISDDACTLSCGMPAQCPGRIPSTCELSCRPLRAEAWAFCEAQCFNAVRTSCVFSFGEP
jgi:hypothetical protein